MLFGKKKTASKGTDGHAMPGAEQQDRAVFRNPLSLLSPTVVNRRESQAGVGTQYLHSGFARPLWPITPRVISSNFQRVNVPGVRGGRFFDFSHDKVQIPGITTVRASEPFIRGATFKGFLPPVQQGSVRYNSRMNKQPLYSGVVAYPRAQVKSPVYTLAGRGN